MKDRDDLKEQFTNDRVDKMRQRIDELKELEAQRMWREEYEGVRELFNRIYKSSKDAIGYASLEGVLLDVNDSFVKLTGYSKEELLYKKKYQDITPEEYHEFEAQMIEKVLRTEEAVEYQKEYIRKDGSRVPILLTAFIVKDSDRKSLGIAAIIKDVTKYKRAEEALRESEEKYRTLVEHTYDLICETSVDGGFLYVSPKHGEVLGYEPSELLGRSIFEYVHSDDRTSVAAEFQRAISTSSSGYVAFRYRHKNGEWRWLESTGKPFRTASGEVRGIIAS